MKLINDIFKSNKLNLNNRLPVSEVINKVYDMPVYIIWLILMSKLKILLVYPNLSMMMAPLVSYGIFTMVLKNEGCLVDIFDCNPYIGEGTSVDVLPTQMRKEPWKLQF